ncbi:MAG: hypothetical protein LBC64_07965 [Fibromonadaceae bacterium]|jgi:hypothetical protein|nr:hypothetical protein [Fibromonadaceae bacterium]
MVLIGRAVNEISINGLEWLLDDNDKPMRFINGNTAKQFLFDNGESIENIYAYWFENEETGFRLNIE